MKVFLIFFDIFPHNVSHARTDSNFTVQIHEIIRLANVLVKAWLVAVFPKHVNHFPVFYIKILSLK